MVAKTRTTADTTSHVLPFQRLNSTTMFDAMLPRSPNTVLTGAASGLGRAFAYELATRRSKMFLADIDESGLAETASTVESLGGHAQTMRVDVANLDDMKRMHQEATSYLGSVDLLINNAGVAVGGKVGDIPIEDWQWITGINQWGVIYGCHLFLPAMRERNRGHILNVASIAAFACAGEMGPYNVTKAAVVALTETLAGELSGTDVGATVLCPFFFTTNIHKNARSHTQSVSTDSIDRLMKKNAIQANEVAQIALDACDNNKLYVFPHREAKAIATVKRLLPETLMKKLGPYAAKRSAK